LKVAELLRLTPARRANALRHWFDHLGFPLPRAVDLARLHSEVMLAGPDSAPVVRWPGVEVHRHRGLLQAMRPLPASDPDRVIAWDLHATVDLPSGGLLAARPIRGSGLAIAASQRRDATIRFRRGGEQCHPAARGHRHALKKLLQEADMPPWLRERIPLVYLGEELAVVPGVCVCEGFQAGPGEEGLEIEWRIGPQHFPWTRSVEDF
jgi:tRNA(Ile)-lysidine synthase